MGIEFIVIIVLFPHCVKVFNRIQWYSTIFDARYSVVFVG